jgi:hypothetical protein
LTCAILEKLTDLVDRQQNLQLTSLVEELSLHNVGRSECHLLGWDGHADALATQPHLKDNGAVWQLQPRFVAHGAL